MDISSILTERREALTQAEGDVTHHFVAQGGNPAELKARIAAERNGAPFVLYRDEDATGVSGTGVVATGIVWPDGHAALRWKADDREAASSTSVWTSVADLMRVHGHVGLSKLFYLDGDGDPPEAARGLAVESCAGSSS